EFPLFGADIVEALRQPLESGEITIARGEESVTFPARAMVVLACNPCRVLRRAYDIPTAGWVCGWDSGHLQWRDDRPATSPRVSPVHERRRQPAGQDGH
ncbi:MAG TPA: ATP-binding protein, partial [Nocardioidaceae bacterium]|nr:ATP-binding protein [Nocardioidaceae bacterium]